MSSEEFVPNERLRWARNRKGWSQAELAEQVGTSFEMVSRWERGITVPSPHYRKRLSGVLGQTPEELGLVRDPKHSFTPPSSPFVLLASAHTDAEKTIVSHLKTTLKGRGVTCLSSRQIGKQRNGNTAANLWEVVQAADALLVVISPQSRSSRHVRETLEMADRYQRPVCGVWIAGEHLEQCLPEVRVELAALVDVRQKDTPAMIEETAKAFEQVRLASQNGTEVAQLSLPDLPREAVPSASPPKEILPPPLHSLEPTDTAKPMPSALPQPALSPLPRNRMDLSRNRTGLLIGLAILVIAGTILGSTSLLAHFGLLGARSGPSPVIPARGGTWTDDFSGNPDSFIPNAWQEPFSTQVDQALYLPLFDGDAHGLVHPGAASEVPTIQNGGISADATTWTFHLRPGLVWSDGAPYDARDVDYTWRLWANPKFAATSPQGVNQINSADVSVDHLSITFHLKGAYAPFLQWWVDGSFAPLPAHHFSRMAPDQIHKSPDNLNPQVVSGPFMMAERVPGDHYTLVRNPSYYLTDEGLPYLDKLVFRIVTPDAIVKDLQAGAIDSAWFLDLEQWQTYQRLTNYTLTTPPTSAGFEAMYFNFHNTVLASHREVRQALAMAIDQQALITQARHSFATPLCTDHPSALHPGYDPDAGVGRYSCSVVFDPALANQLLSDHGWVKGADGVRTRGGQRLEFEYSTTAGIPWRSADEAILQRDFMEIGIKLDLQNYPADTFFGSFLPTGKPSPPTGAVTGRFDIAEFDQSYLYDPDDSLFFACDQFPSAANNFTGGNLGFYCNPALDKLFAQELATADAGVRQQLFEQIHQIYLTDFPFITLYSPLDLAMVRKGTHNYQPSPIAGETVNIWQWWCDHGKC